MADVIVVIGAGSIGQAIARRVSAAVVGLVRLALRRGVSTPTEDLRWINIGEAS